MGMRWRGSGTREALARKELLANVVVSLNGTLGDRRRLVGIIALHFAERALLASNDFMP
jgi:hypothetical protein